MTEVEQSIRLTVATKLRMKPEDVKTNVALIDELGADSLDMAEIIMEMEQNFSLEINDEDVEDFVTISDAARYVETELAKRKA